MLLARIALILIGLMTGLFGVFSLLDPARLAELIQMSPLASGALTEIRAFYGGLEIGLGLFWIGSAFRPAFYRAALWSAVWVWVAVALARVLGLVLDESFNQTMAVILAAEVFSAALAFIAVKRLPDETALR